MATTYTGVPTNVTSLTKNIQSGSATSPIVVTTTTPHLFGNGDTVTFSGTGTSLNFSGGNYYVITVLSATTFSINGSTSVGIFVIGTVTDKSLTPQFQIPSDGDDFDVSSINPAFQTLADRTQYLALRDVSQEAEIVVLQGEVTMLNSEVATLNSEVSTINGEITTINGEITTINAKFGPLAIAGFGEDFVAGRNTPYSSNAALTYSVSYTPSSFSSVQAGDKLTTIINGTGIRVTVGSAIVAWRYLITFDGGTSYTSLSQGVLSTVGDYFLNPTLTATYTVPSPNPTLQVSLHLELLFSTTSGAATTFDDGFTLSGFVVPSGPIVFPAGYQFQTTVWRLL